MFRTLYSRLALTLFLLLSLVGFILIQIISHASTLYQQEVAQKLNSTLAEHIVAENSLIQNQMINYAVSEPLFHDLMVINPSIELYLLDRQGNIMGYNAPEEKIKRKQVALEPIEQFLVENTRYPLKGDDPRSLEAKKVFSAAKISNEDAVQGYLYIVLGSEQYDDVVQMLGNSYIFESSLQVLGFALAAALIGGMIVFALQTRRLCLLASVMRDYANGSVEGGLSMRFPDTGKSSDEIGDLGQQYNVMAGKISEQIKELKRTDGMRREMVANISHDLRTPLTTMRGYLETLLLKKQTLSPQEQTLYIETALSYSQHLGRLVEQLFELARLDSFDSVVYAEPFSMCELVQDVTQSFLLQAEKKSIQIEATLSPDAPMIYGDIAMMQRVLENLIENGLRHTPAGGRIVISVEVDSGNVVVRVADTGCGIPMEDVPRIFERFYQQDVNRTGSSHAGLGLAIVKRILELHGSAIKVRSKVDHGTTFSFQLVVNTRV